MKNFKSRDLQEVKKELRETQKAIKSIKDYFERSLSDKLNLMRVSAPLFVRPETGCNDNLSGVEKAVAFNLQQYDENVEIVQSLAKWKRMALKWYGFASGEGLYTDMDAIRPHEILDRTHSIYVDQWDWEKVIRKEDRSFNYLEKVVESIYESFKDTEDYLDTLYPSRFSKKLPANIYFIDSQELEDRYPKLSPEDREYEIAREKKAVFISKIGGRLRSGISHGSRSPDYDDWDLNGDIIFWNPSHNNVLELSSMGIRVDEEALKRQLALSGTEDRKTMDYHRELLEGRLPYTIGGGIGQSRICMYFLEKKHIGEVQASVWTQDVKDQCDSEGILLL